MMIWPLSNLIREEAPGSYALTILAEYLLPFYLYVFLSLVVFDIFLLINRIFRIVPLSRLRLPKVRNWCFLSLLMISASIVAGGIINYKTIRISEYKIGLNRRSSSLQHLKIAFASDLHLQERTNIDFVKRFVSKILEIKPDLMIYGGDILEGDGGFSEMEPLISVLREIRTKYGVYTVPGNHEFYGGQENGSFFSGAGIDILCDSVVIIDSSFTLAGRCDSHLDSRKYAQDLLNKAPSSLPVIVVDHRPTELDQVSLTKADIQLSGHTHHGQLFPINLITEKVYELSWGYKKIRNTHFFVSSGVSLWGPHVRTAGKSEIMVINVDFR